MTFHLPTRRSFIRIVPVAGAAYLAACSPKTDTPVPTAPTTASPAPGPSPAAPAAPVVAMPGSPSLPMLDEKDTQAAALGYVADAARVDKLRYKNFAEGSQCGNCALYQGKPGDTAGPCPLYSGKAVSAQGWCASWTRKA